MVQGCHVVVHRRSPIKHRVRPGSCGTQAHQVAAFVATVVEVRGTTWSCRQGGPLQQSRPGLVRALGGNDGKAAVEQQSCHNRRIVLPNGPLAQGNTNQVWSCEHGAHNRTKQHRQEGRSKPASFSCSQYDQADRPLKQSRRNHT